MKRILFPTDFSETANNAFVYVLEMAKAFNAEVIVLHVYNLPPVSYEGYPIYVAEVFETIELGKFENMKDQIPYLRKIAEDHQLNAIKMSYVLEEGDLIDVINRIAKKEKIDLIVMGTEGASGLKEVFLGSNTGSVIESVPITLLSVPNKVKFSTINKIAFTTRFRAKDHKALLQVVDFANRVNAKVKCLYVRTADSDFEETQIDKWREDFKNDPVEFIIIPDNDIEGTIFEFLDSEKIDILAMLTYKHSFFEDLFRTSFTKKLSYHSEIPILVFHEK